MRCLLGALARKKRKFEMGLISIGKKLEERVVVDLAGPQIKIVIARNESGKTVFRDVYSKTLAQNTDAEAMKEVLEYFKQNRVQPSRVICSIPSKLFISKNVEIPSTEKDEIAKIIDLQAGRFTPYSRDEIVIDFLCMETPAQHYTSVLLVIVNRSLVDRYCRIFEDMGIQIKIAIASEALALTYEEMLGAGPEDYALGGICVGDDTTDLTIMDHRQMVFVRSLPVGADHFQAGRELAAAELINELNKSLTAYHDQGIGKQVKSLILSGKVADSEWLCSEITANCPVLQRFQTQVQGKDSLTLFDLSEVAKKKIEESKTNSFFELMATLEKSEKTQVDLIPKEVKIRRRFREESKEITSLGITIMTIFAVLSLFLYAKIYFKNQRMEKIQIAGQASFDEARLLERVSTKNRVVRKIIKNRGKGLSAFDEVTGLLGESTYLAHYGYDLEGKLRLGGTAESMSQVFALVNRLEASGRYYSVKATETKSRREGTRDVADFEIECILPDSPLFEKIEAEKQPGGVLPSGPAGEKQAE